MAVTTAAALLLLLSCVVAAAAAEVWPRRGLLRSISGAAGDGGAKPGDFAVDLDGNNFDSFLKAAPANYAVVEFFASWCPACRNYKPQYEKVARLFNGPEAAHPGIVIMTRVDCANKANRNLCEKFSVSHYPMLLWGPPAKFPFSSWDPKQDKSELNLIDDARTAEQLLGWINKRLGSSFHLDDEKYENEGTLSANSSNPGQIARGIFDVEEATANAFDIILEHKMIKPENRASLIKFLQLIVAHHPSKWCRRGSAEILVNFDDHFPSLLSLQLRESSELFGSDAVKNHQICGKDVPRGYWIFCRGSKNETRGFSCGLWLLLHSLSVRVGDGESEFAFTTMCEFIHNFFICDECRTHFYEMCSSVAAPFNSTRGLSMWLWSAHNKVNERLAEKEKALETGDPRFPKVVWPPKELCPSCYRSVHNSGKNMDWDEEKVFDFLVNYYGKELVYSYKDADIGKNSKKVTTIAGESSNTHAVAVPIGAALGVALASCTFGALACFWRAQQKRRKYSHLRSLKNI